jgi:hypothetical protein
MDSTTVFGNDPTVGVNNPFGIATFGTDTDSVIVVDCMNNRIVGLFNAGTIYQNMSVVATEWAPGQPLCLPYDVFVDSRNGSNLYVTNYCVAIVVLYANMQSVNPLPQIVATGGLNAPWGVAVDSHYNVIVASYMNSHIMFFPPGSANGTVNATVMIGLGFPDNSSMGLNLPGGILLDEPNSYLYVADVMNNRIQRYSLNSTWPCNGTTVAGGNGPGNYSNQLNQPNYVRISKTGAMYIADTNNNRIQRWQLGATEGVTIAGDPGGNAGSSATTLNSPAGVALSANETQIYVTDANNNRVQRFQLI